MLALTPASLGGAHDLLARALVFVVLTAGGLAALASLFARKPAATAASGQPLPGQPVLGGAFAGALAGLLAVTLGGPGALPWLVLACLAGAAIHHAEARLVGRLAPAHLAGRTGLVEHGLSLAQALTATLAALAAGALLHGQQAAEAVVAVTPVRGWVVGLGLAALAAFAFVRADRGLGRWLGPLTLVALAVHVALMSLLVFGGSLGSVLSDMFSRSLGGEAALAGIKGRRSAFL